MKVSNFFQQNFFTLNSSQMMIKLRYSLLFSSLLFSSLLKGQTPQFMLKQAKLDNALQEKIKESVEEYEVFELDLSSVDRYLKSYDSNREIPLKITIAPNRVVEFKFAENEIRAANYTHLIVKESMTELIPKGRCDTYKSVGKINGSYSLLYATSKYFSLNFVENGENMSLVALSRFVNTESAKNLKNMVVLYKDRHWKKLAKDCPQIEIDTVSNVASINNTSEAIRYLELAVVADHEFYVGTNSNPDQFILPMIQQVSNRYESDFQLSVRIVHYEVFSQVPSNYPFSGNLLNRWDQLRSYFNPVTTSQGTNPPSSYAGLRQCVARDVVHLFTFNQSDVAGTSRGNSVFRTGWKSICGTDDDTWLSLGTGFCEDRTGFAYSASNLVGLNWTTPAHEIGHNFGAGHTSCGIMCASFCQCTPENFSSSSISAINGHIYGTGTIPLACPPHRFGDCLLNVPIEPSQVDILGPNIVCNGSATYSINTQIWAIWSTDDPDVSLPSFVVDYTMPVYCTVPGSHTVKASFYHNCQWVTMVRTFWVGSPQLPIVDSNEDACDNGSSTCKTLTISFDKTTTDGLTDFTVSNQSCTWCNIYTTGSFAAGSITVWNIHAGECINVTGTAYNACGSTSFSEVFCNGQTPRQVEDIEVKAYPNPTNNTLYLVSKNTGTISIWDVLGKQQHSYSVEAGNEIEVNTTTLPAGIYLVKFDSPEAKVIKKITITH